MSQDFTATLTSLSTSTMATTLPNVNFGFEDLKDRMALFTMQFDEFIERGRKNILEEKNGFAQNIAENKDKQRIHRKQIEHYRQVELDVAERIQKETQEALEASAAISSMSLKKSSKLETQSHLKTQIAQLTSAIAKKRSLRAAERQTLSAQASKNAPELAFWEDNLGMRIEGAGVPDHLKIVYTHLVDCEWGREFWFIVNMVARDYEVIQCRPKLPSEAVTKAVDKLNETRDFAAFLKEMRQLFKKDAE